MTQTQCIADPGRGGQETRPHGSLFCLTSESVNESSLLSAINGMIGIHSVSNGGFIAQTIENEYNHACKQLLSFLEG